MSSTSHQISSPASNTVSHLLELPPELRDMIVSYIKDPRDLKALCFAHWNLFDVANPRLYREMYLSMEQLTRLVSSLHHRKNTDLDHVRYLQLQERRNTYDETKHGRSLYHLLHALPRTKLKFILMETTSEVSSLIDTTILQTQDQLEMLSIHAGGTLTRKPLKLTQLQLAAITTLQLYMKTKKDIKAHIGMIQKLHKLKDLKIAAMSYFLAEDRQRLPADPSAIFHALFRNNTPLGVAIQKLKLERLCLDGLNLIDCGSELEQCLEHDHLKDLALLNCAGTGIVDESLRQPKIKLRTIIDDRFENCLPQGLAAMENLLRNSSGLEVLKLIYQNLPPALPTDSPVIAWTALQTHAATLRILFLNEWLGKEGGWDANKHRNIKDFDAFCRATTRLERLAIRPPTPSTNTDTFTAFLECLKHVKTLISLRLFISPSATAIKNNARPQEMSELAMTIFETLHETCKCFTALDLTVEDKTSKARGATVEYCFLRIMVFDQSGKRVVKLQSLGRGELGFYEPASDIFFEDTDDTWHINHARASAPHGD